MMGLYLLRVHPRNVRKELSENYFGASTAPNKNELVEELVGFVESGKIMVRDSKAWQKAFDIMTAATKEDLERVGFLIEALGEVHNTTMRPKESKNGDS